MYIYIIMFYAYIISIIPGSLASSISMRQILLETQNKASHTSSISWVSGVVLSHGWNTFKLYRILNRSMLNPNRLLICSSFCLENYHPSCSFAHHPHQPSQQKQWDSSAPNAWEFRLPKDGAAEKAGVKTTRSLVSGRQVHMGRQKNGSQPGRSVGEYTYICLYACFIYIYIYTYIQVNYNIWPTWNNGKFLIKLPFGNWCIPQIKVSEGFDDLSESGRTVGR